MTPPPAGFRQDYFDELGETIVHELLNRLSTLLQAGLRLRKQTQYAYPYKEGLSGVWQDCIMDLFPTHAAELTKKGWEIKKDFAGWATPSAKAKGQGGRIPKLPPA